MTFDHAAVMRRCAEDPMFAEAWHEAADAIAHALASGEIHPERYGVAQEYRLSRWQWRLFRHAQRTGVLYVPRGDHRALQALWSLYCSLHGDANVMVLPWGNERRVQVRPPGDHSIVSFSEPVPAEMAEQVAPLAWLAAHCGRQPERTSSHA